MTALRSGVIIFGRNVIASYRLSFQDGQCDRFKNCVYICKTFEEKTVDLFFCTQCILCMCHIA